MTNNLKIGDKFLLPVTITNPVDERGIAYTMTAFSTGVYLYPPDAETLIPASTLTDLQAENARLRTALTDIVTYVERSNPWDIEAGVTYEIAVNALGGGE